MTARDRLDAIETRANAATGGPWIVYMTMHAEPKVIREKGGYPAGLIADPSSAPADYGIADAEFIAHARTDVPALVAALRAVLDLAVERGDHDPTEWVHVRDIRAAIDAALGGHTTERQR